MLGLLVARAIDVRTIVGLTLRWKNASAAAGARLTESRNASVGDRARAQAQRTAARSGLARVWRRQAALTLIGASSPRHPRLSC